MMSVVVASEMARVEKETIEKGASAKLYMERAGLAIAKVVASFEKQPVTLLIGKGNNGGDAFVCGIELLKQGYEVYAILLFDTFSSLSQEFEKAGGTFCKGLTPGIVVDGIFGTGFSGETPDEITQVITEANKQVVVAIDIPSGLDGTSGAACTATIEAHTTVTLGMPKIGLFLRDGINHIGRLVIADFGMDSSSAKPIAHLVEEADIKPLLPKIIRDRHKYQAGYVVAFAGSPGMPGAALLATYATLRAGAGVVRLFHDEGMEAELSNSPYELIKTPWDKKTIIEELKRASSVLIGPGLKDTAQVSEIVHAINVPAVIDADGLALLEKTLPMPLVITPHKKEMERLLAAEPTMENVQAYANEKKITIVLKGAPTMVFHPDELPAIINRGDPGMATAGSGDVLTGIIAALLAQKLTPRNSAIVGVYLHAMAGELAAKELSSYDMIASDIIEALPDIFTAL